MPMATIAPEDFACNDTCSSSNGHLVVIESLQDGSPIYIFHFQSSQNLASNKTQAFQWRRVTFGVKEIHELFPFLLMGINTETSILRMQTAFAAEFRFSNEWIMHNGFSLRGPPGG
jgi:hypothetical protein